mgnify:CR=1 FL=1
MTQFQDKETLPLKFSGRHKSHHRGRITVPTLYDPSTVSVVPADSKTVGTPDWYADWRIIPLRLSGRSVGRARRI